ncbi:gag-pol fusion protein [Pimephales promelas]|nr:gag-pol fusion protein [Pimephales promelas]
MAPKKVAQFKQRDEAVPVEELEEPEGAGGVPQMDDESRQLTLQDLAVMFRKNMEFQQRQETQMEQEAARQEQRWKMLQHQFNLLREEVDARTNPDLPSEMRGNVSNASVAHARNPVPGMIEPKLQKLNDADDIEHFLTTFERIALACKWRRSEWALQLVPLLTGKARSAYVHMDIEETLDYDQVKSAILSKYAINPETYRQRFRSLEIEPDETPKELYVRLKELYEKWVQPKGKTVEAVAEVIILEQYLRMLSPELQVWVREHNPSSAVEAASLADVFVAARSRSQVWGAAQRGNRDNKSLPTIGRGEGKLTLPQNLTVPVEVNGKKVKALIDTGSMQTLVESQLVPKQANANNGKVVIRCVHGEEQIYPTVEVQVVVQEQPYLLKVAVVEQLPYPVILGQDFPLLFNLLPFNSACSMVMTRAQAMQSMDESETLKSFPFFDAELEAGPVKVRKSRQQRRQEKYRYRDAEGQEQGGKLDELIGYKIPSNMAELQQTDPVLSPLYQRAILTSQEEGGNAVEDRVVERFVLQEKVLYRQQGDGFQMVVPKAVQNIVLSLGHSIPWAGQQVLVMLPTVSRQARSKRILHVNLLKEWSPRKECLLIRSVEDEEEVEEQYFPGLNSAGLKVDHLPEFQQQQLQSLCNPELFQAKPGQTKLVEHDIVLKEDAVPKRLSYRIPERLLPALKKELDLMISVGVIEPSKSEWCSPVVLVPKKDGTTRFCIDFRYLNSVSKFDSYPMPRIEELIERLGNAKYLSTVDLCKGYWQVPLSSRSKELTAFRTPWGLHHFKTMPFGLHGAPPTFQRLMDQVLHGLSDFTSAYLDDIVIFSETWEEHLKHLQMVLRRIQEAGLTINPDKCALAKKEIEYLGYVLGNGVIRPQVGKVQAIKSFTLPKTKKQVRSFLGLVGWYRRFVPNFSSRAAALTDLIKKNGPNQIQWSEQAQRAFQDIQGALQESPVLHSPRFDQPFVLQTDASGVGLGAVLLQGEVGNYHPVAYISRKLFPREMRYSTIEKECLAVKWALDSLRYYLLGSHSSYSDPN